VFQVIVAASCKVMGQERAVGKGLATEKLTNWEK
jgi:hypothetical protein